MKIEITEQAIITIAGNKTIKVTRESPEYWTAIEDYDDLLLISTYGRIKNIQTNTIYSYDNSCAYCRTTIGISGKTKHFDNHVEVGKGFLENPENLPQVNHKNRDHRDCHVVNLEWKTKKGNMVHAFLTQALPPLVDKVFPQRENTNSLSLILYDVNYNKVREYQSVSEASQCRFNRQVVKAQCERKRTKAHRGYHFRYATDPAPCPQFNKTDEIFGV